MRFVRKISRNYLSVLDFGAASVIVMIAEKKPDGSFRLLGSGESTPAGVHRGEITNLGDAVECVVEATRKAAGAAGVAPGALYFNFNDPHAEVVRPVGQKMLSGEGQIRAADIEAARAAAERSVGHFEKFMAYSKETGFLIDDRDTVESPAGIFGHKLEASLVVILTRSAVVESWRKLMARAGHPKSVPVLSAWSTAYGVLPLSGRQSARLVLDVGSDFFNFFIFEKNRIADLKVLASGDGEFLNRATAAVRELKGAREFAEPAIVTGDLAEDEKIRAALGAALSSELRTARAAPAAGLIAVADELERGAAAPHPRGTVVSRLRRKAEQFLSEYF